MNDKEINEAVAKKLGYKYHEASKSIEEFGSIPLCESPDGQYHRFLPDFCHSIDAAWEIVEKMGHFQMALDYRNKWCVGIGWQDEWRILAEAKTAPMAICLAFLKLPHH